MKCKTSVITPRFRTMQTKGGELPTCVIVSIRLFRTISHFSSSERQGIRPGKKYKWEYEGAFSMRSAATYNIQELLPDSLTHTMYEHVHMTAADPFRLRLRNTSPTDRPPARYYHECCIIYYSTASCEGGICARLHHTCIPAKKPGKVGKAGCCIRRMEKPVEIGKYPLPDIL